MNQLRDVAVPDDPFGQVLEPSVLGVGLGEDAGQGGGVLVAGFDLEARREVHVAERRPGQWRRIGYGGTGTLVCFYCFHGFEAPKGTRVPLVIRGRLGGRV